MKPKLKLYVTTPSFFNFETGVFETRASCEEWTNGVFGKSVVIGRTPLTTGAAWNPKEFNRIESLLEPQR